MAKVELQDGSWQESGVTAPPPPSRVGHIVRGGLWLGFFAVILVAWWMLYATAVEMGLDLMGRPGGGEVRAPEPMVMPEMAPGAAVEDAADGMAESAQMDDTLAIDGMDMGGMSMTVAFGPLWAMWAIMMAAMMLPTMVPTIQSYEALIRRGAGTWGGLFAVVAGYFVVWVGFAAAITLAQLGLFRIGVIDMMGVSQYRLVTAALLVVVGLYQFTPQKDACHGVCHAPTFYFLGHWKPGTLGGLRMGLALGAYCVGCCWGFMALGFVGGVMSLLWMGLATFVMILEKIPAIGHHLLRPVGVALVLAGLVTAFWPTLAPIIQGA